MPYGFRNNDEILRYFWQHIDSFYFKNVADFDEYMGRLEFLLKHNQNGFPGNTADFDYKLTFILDP